MRDFIFVVDDARRWHAHNRVLNPTHYPATLPEMLLTAVQPWGAGIVYLFNQKMHCKYGVVSRQHFLDDLLNWRTFYLAGRLQKPVRLCSVRQEDAQQPAHDQQGTIAEAMQRNRDLATVAALCLLPARFDMHAFLTAVVGLSYRGDPRVGVAENPQKTLNIVQGQWSLLEAIYMPRLQQRPDLCVASCSEKRFSFTMDASEMALMARLASLPMAKEDGRGGTAPLVRPFAKHLCLHKQGGGERAAAMVASALCRLVQRPAIVQALKGILTVGPQQALYYGVQKMRRRLYL